jgi:hypothetical protein
MSRFAFSVVIGEERASREAARAFSIEGRYLYREGGASGSMMVKEKDSAIEIHISAEIGRACAGEVHACRVTAKGVRIISRGDSILAHFMSSEEGSPRLERFEIEFLRDGAVINVHGHGGFFGLAGSCNGKWTKEGVTMPAGGSGRLSAVERWRDRTRTGNGRGVAAQEGLSGGFYSRKVCGAGQGITCRTGCALFGRTWAVRGPDVSEDHRNEFTG